MNKLDNFQSMTGGVLPAGLMKSYRKQLDETLGLVAKSKITKQVLTMLSEIGPSKQPLTIVGQVGVGKSTFAKVVHMSGSDWWRPFIEIDLAGMDENTSMRILFGHKEERIFTSGEVKPGCATEALNSTLCLKNFDQSAKLVQRAIYDAYKRKEFFPVDSKDGKPFDSRLIFTVKGQPDNLKKVGYLDENIFELMNGNVVFVPPLAKRREDIVPLAEKFIHDWANTFYVAPKKLSKEAERWLKRAPWIDNAIQLKKSIYFACMNTESEILGPENFALAHDGNLVKYQEKQLEELSIQELVEKKLEIFLSRLGKYEATHLYEAIMNRVEEPLLRLVLNYADGNQIKASRMLGINRNTMRAKIVKYGIKSGGKGQ